ncbi:MAG: cytochrome c oxidase subunit II [Planctomycetota bacterium]|jgi:cytochrome c oxidase subunit 2
MLNLLATATSGPEPGSYFGMPEQASTIAGDVDWIFDFITWVSLFFFVVIVCVMVYFMFRYRRRAHVTSTGGPTHNTPLELTWTAIPLVLVIVIFYIGLKGYVHITTPPENAYVIQVTGQRWSWTFSYPNGATETNTLHVPVGRPVKLNMRSVDVLHSMFIPAFRVKQDVVPGRRTQLWFEATREGEFDLFCAEYCGTSHSQMTGKVIVYAEDRFEAVIEALAAWIDRVPDEKLYLAGGLLYNQCASCHSLDGSSMIGPSFQETRELYKTGGRRTLADGSAVNVDEAYLRSSIMKPLDQIAAHSATGKPYPKSMPTGIGDQLGPRKVEALVNFIMRLDEAAPDGALGEVLREDLVEEAQETE